MHAERAPLLARDAELGATPSSSSMTMVLDDVERATTCRATTSSARAGAYARVVVIATCLALVVAACVASAPHGVAFASLGSSRKSSKIDEGSTKRCTNAAADNAAGTFQIETEECSDSASAVPGCLGSHSSCRFCQTHMAANRNNDWPLCPSKVCDENGVFGCKSNGKLSKRDIAWRVMREHVLAHNRMVDGVKIGKCLGTSQDRALGRFVYHDAECEKQGLPGCTGAGSSCRFCNVKNAKKATKDWPVCPDVVCENYDVKKKNCDTLKRYAVPDETPPKDWDEHSLPKELDVDEADVGLDDFDEDDEVTVTHHHSHHHHHSHDDDDDDEDEDAYDDDDDDDDESRHHKHKHSSIRLGKEDEGDDNDSERETSEEKSNSEEDESRHHKHQSSSSPLGKEDEGDDDDSERKTSEEKSNSEDDADEDFESEIKRASEVIERSRHHEKSVLSTKEAQELDSLVFSSFDEASR